MKIDDYGFVLSGFYDLLMTDSSDKSHGNYSYHFDSIDEILNSGLIKLYSPFLSSRDLFKSGNPLRDDFTLEIAHNSIMLGRIMFTWISDVEIEIFSLPCSEYQRCLMHDVETINKSLVNWLICLRNLVPK